MKKSNLNVVAVPIGNKKDITKRAVETLKQSELIITENQNTTKKLFNLLNIKFQDKKFITFGDFNNKERVKEVLENIINYKESSLISEAGTPLISDPGYKIISEIRERSLSIEVKSVPGPSSLTAHLSISGLPTDNFMFIGFLPKKSGKAFKTIKSLEKINKEIKTTFVLFESKYRIEKTLKLISENYPNSTVSIGKELTKKFEQVYYGNTSEVLEKLKKEKIRGEFVIHLQI